MQTLSHTELKKIYKARKEKLCAYMNEQKIGAAIFIDKEEKRDANLRYFSGHANDAILILFADAHSVLIAWDEILAKKNAIADELIPYTSFNNNEIRAIKETLSANVHLKNKNIALPPSTTYPAFLHFVNELSDFDVHCNEKSVHDFAVSLRMIKDDYEIALTKEACRIGDAIINSIEEKLKAGEIKTEIDVALFIEKKLREYGAEKTGFDTLAAGPNRSFAIHAFPNYTNSNWGSDGLSILDFGVVFNGYTSDTTLTVARGKLSKTQAQILTLVQTAYDECLPLYKNGLPILDAAKKADEIFAKAHFAMPHGLGHAIGLEIHESPRVSTKAVNDNHFAPGMILTLEPGLYDESAGGARLENDILILENGNEVLTHSRIIRS